MRALGDAELGRAALVSPNGDELYSISGIEALLSVERTPERGRFGI